MHTILNIVADIKDSFTSQHGDQGEMLETM
jgi:hypothetical protein